MLKTYISLPSGKPVNIMIDDTSAVSQINHIGPCHSEEYNSLVVQILEFCISHNISWLTAAHIPGSSNVIADGESRHFYSHDTEWMLNSELLTGALKTPNVQPEIDLFASCLLKQLPVFCSFRPYSEADKKLLFSSGFQLYFTGATENHSGAFRPQMYLCNY